MSDLKTGSLRALRSELKPIARTMDESQHTCDGALLVALLFFFGEVFPDDAE